MRENLNDKLLKYRFTQLKPLYVYILSHYPTISPTGNTRLIHEQRYESSWDREWGSVKSHMNYRHSNIIDILMIEKILLLSHEYQSDPKCLFQYIYSGCQRPRYRPIILLMLNYELAALHINRYIEFSIWFSTKFSMDHTYMCNVYATLLPTCDIP